jgi:hypothetical protein
LGESHLVLPFSTGPKADVDKRKINFITFNVEELLESRANPAKKN